MTDHDALLRSILEHPQDDLPRLVYADWLDDAGEVERAEFVRLSVRMAKYVDASGNTTRHDTDFGKMISEFAPYSGGGVCSERGFIHEWSSRIIPGTWGPLAGLHQWDVWNTNLRMKMVWHRGFISSVTIDWPMWLRHHAGLFWSPRQTVECDGDCSRWHGLPPGAVMSPKNLDKLFKCRDCKGTGRIPRPFVPTAQPITDLILTTAPDISHYDFALRWPDLLCKMIGGEPCW